MFKGNGYLDAATTSPRQTINNGLEWGGGLCRRGAALDGLLAAYVLPTLALLLESAAARHTEHRSSVPEEWAVMRQRSIRELTRTELGSDRDIAPSRRQGPTRAVRVRSRCIGRNASSLHDERAMWCTLPASVRVWSHHCVLKGSRSRMHLDEPFGSLASVSDRHMNRMHRFTLAYNTPRSLTQMHGQPHRSAAL